MIEWWGPVLHEYYAGTEGNGFVYCDSAAWLAHPGHRGLGDHGQVHIVDDDGEEVPTGRPGTIYFGGGAEFSYHNDPDKTAASRDPRGRGWSTLGDVGYLDDDGFLYLTDRKAYMIITGGVNVYPQEAENVLAMHPKVADVAVLGVPNDDFGEEVKAVVEPIADGDAGPELERELIAYCREHLADVKCPRSVDFRAGAAPPPHRQALQAPAQGRVLEGPREPHHLTALGHARARPAGSGRRLVDGVRPAKPSSGQCHQVTASSPTSQHSQYQRPLGARAGKSTSPRSMSRSTTPSAPSSSRHAWMSAGSAGTRPWPFWRTSRARRLGRARARCHRSWARATTSPTHPSAALASSTVHERGGSRARRGQRVRVRGHACRLAPWARRPPVATDSRSGPPAIWHDDAARAGAHSTRGDLSTRDRFARRPADSNVGSVATGRGG